MLQLFGQSNAKTLHALSDTSDFKKVRHEKDVVLYERWITLQNGKEGREVKAEFTLKANLDEIISLVQDDARTMVWNKNLSDCKIIKDDDGHWITYYKYDIPWPVSDQDCTLYHHIEKSKDAGKPIAILFSSIDHQSFPRQSNIKRIDEVYGKWEIIPLADSHYRINYLITTTPNPTLPKWITDPLIRSSLVNAMSAFKEMLEND